MVVYQDQAPTITYAQLRPTTIQFTMSRDTESVISSAVSLSGVESLSDEGSTISAGGNKISIAGNSANPLFDLGDGDLRLTVRYYL